MEVITLCLMAESAGVASRRVLVQSYIVSLSWWSVCFLACLLLPQGGGSSLEHLPHGQSISSTQGLAEK